MSAEEIQIKAEEIAADLIAEKLKVVDELEAKQRTICTDAYMMGLYNGMELVKSIFTGKKPVFLAQNRIGEVIEAKEVEENENSGQQE